jgi:hypothetical protein
MGDRAIGFTGTQHGLTTRQGDQLRRVLVALKHEGYDWMRNGDCVGADWLAATIWREIGGLIWLHPPDRWEKRAFIQADRVEKPKPYLVRNRDIVDASIVMVGTPREMTEQSRGGTWSTIRYARKLGRELHVIYADGFAGLAQAHAAVEGE